MTAYEIGETYRIPHIIAPWQPLNRVAAECRAWPIWLPAHRDPELGVRRRHYHADWRFLDTGDALNATGRVIVPPLGARVEYREARCLRQYAGPEIERRLAEIAANLAPAMPPGARIDLARPVCPHRGADLAGVPPDATGTIRCPVHGLRFCGRSGRMIAP